MRGRVSTLHEFQGRLWIVQDQIIDAHFWCHELNPTSVDKRPIEELFAKHMLEYSIEEIRQLLKLPPGDMQVLFKARLNGDIVEIVESSHILIGQDMADWMLEMKIIH